MSRLLAPAARAERVRACVCVPARGEARQLPRLLRALQAQTGLDPQGWSAAFLLDGDPDGSGELLRRFAVQASFAVHVEIGREASEPNAGRARRAAFDLGLRALGGGAGALLTTDADSAPASDWIATALDALETADVVTGRVTRDGAADGDLQGRLERYYDRLYALRRRLDPVPWEPEPRHAFAAGANLALRADAYRSLGGFVELACGEDGRLVDDAMRAGLRVRRDDRLRVWTSSRRRGRAPGGLADGLSRLDREGEAAVALTHPSDAAWQYRGHAAARAAFEALDRPAVAARLAALIGLPASHLRGVAAACPNGEAFAARIVPAPPGGFRSISLAQAEAALEELEPSLACEAA